MSDHPEEKQGALGSLATEPEREDALTDPTHVGLAWIAASARVAPFGVRIGVDAALGSGAAGGDAV